MIQDFAKLVPKTLMNRSGKVFYSGRNAFEPPSELYVLGINPGGAPDDYKSETVSSHTKWLLKSGPSDWSAYRDETWAGRPAGTASMQPRLLHMFRRLGLNPGDVAASNLVFVRSVRKATLKGDFSRLALQCWPFHRAVMEKLRVRVVLCLGADSGNWVREQVGARTLEDEFVEDNNRGWRSSLHRNADGLRVVTATHPSIADWTSPKTDPTRLVRKALA